MMRVLILILAAIAAVYLLVNMARNRRNPGPTAKSPRRLSNYQRRVAAQLSAIDDHRVAAAAMMVATAEHDGAMTEQEETIIIEQTMSQFAIDETTALKLLKYAQAAVRKVDDLDLCLQTLAPTIGDQCTPDECDDLLEILADIALQSSDTSAVAISNAIANLRNQLTRV